jgi:hypothetical protein
MLGLMADATLVLTDSGGLQEETTALGVPCLTMRENTERPITVEQGTNTMVGRDRAGHRGGCGRHPGRPRQARPRARILGRPCRRAHRGRPVALAAAARPERLRTPCWPPHHQRADHRRRRLLPGLGVCALHPPQRLGQRECRVERNVSASWRCWPSARPAPPSSRWAGSPSATRSWCAHRRRRP